MRLASDPTWWVWRGLGMVNSSSSIARLRLCLEMRRERDATGAVRSSLRPGKARKHDPARASLLFVSPHTAQHSTGITYSSRDQAHQQQPLTSLQPPSHRLQWQRCRTIYICIRIYIYWFFIITAVVSPILDNDSLHFGPRPRPCRSRPVGLSRSCRRRKNIHINICLA